MRIRSGAERYESNTVQLSPRFLYVFWSSDYGDRDSPFPFGLQGLRLFRALQHPIAWPIWRGTELRGSCFGVAKPRAPRFTRLPSHTLRYTVSQFNRTPLPTCFVTYIQSVISYSYRFTSHAAIMLREYGDWYVTNLVYRNCHRLLLAHGCKLVQVHSWLTTLSPDLCVR